jgi:hypothetical protein
MSKEKAWSLLGARRQNLFRLRVEKLGCLISTCGSSCTGPVHIHHPPAGSEVA